MDVTFSAYFHVAVTLLFSLITLSLAISFVIRPAEKKLLILKPMSKATLYSIMAAVAGGVGAAALNASAAPIPGQPELISRVVVGLAESMVPAVLGYALLSLSWMLVSVGLRR